MRWAIELRDTRVTRVHKIAVAFTIAVEFTPEEFTAEEPAAVEFTPEEFTPEEFTPEEFTPEELSAVEFTAAEFTAEIPLKRSADLDPAGSHDRIPCSDPLIWRSLRLTVG